MKQAAFKAKKREGVEAPAFDTLGEDMDQGGKQRHSVPHGLDNQMGQGGKGYKRSSPVKKLREQMGQ